MGCLSNRLIITDKGEPYFTLCCLHCLTEAHNTEDCGHLDTAYEQTNKNLFRQFQDWLNPDIFVKNIHSIGKH